MLVADEGGQTGLLGEPVLGMVLDDGLEPRSRLAEAVAEVKRRGAPARLGDEVVIRIELREPLDDIDIVLAGRAERLLRDELELVGRRQRLADIGDLTHHEVVVDLKGAHCGVVRMLGLRVGFHLDDRLVEVARLTQVDIEPVTRQPVLLRPLPAVDDLVVDQLSIVEPLVVGLLAVREPAEELRIVGSDLLHERVLRLRLGLQALRLLIVAVDDAEERALCKLTGVAERAAASRLSKRPSRTGVEQRDELTRTRLVSVPVAELGERVELLLCPLRNLLLLAETLEEEARQRVALLMLALRIEEAAKHR